MSRRENREPMLTLGRTLSRAEAGARETLRRLEEVMVRCGYVHDGVYNSAIQAVTGRGSNAVVLIWRGGKLLLKRRSRATTEPTLVSVDEMVGGELIGVTRHLPFLFDYLERDVRHRTEMLEKAAEGLRVLIGRIEADPRPAKELQEAPADVPEDPSTEVLKR